LKGIEYLPPEISKNYFDVITCQHVIEHLDDPIKLIEDFKKILAKDGTLILVIPINDDEWKEHQKIYQPEDVAELISKVCSKEQIFEIILRKETIRTKPNGDFVQEAIVFINFGGNKDGQQKEEKSRCKKNKPKTKV